MADYSEPKNNVIAIYGVVTCIVLFVVSVALMAWYNLVFQKWQFIEAARPDPELASLENYELERLTTYNIDSTTGPARIPIELAMELEARQPWRPQAPWPAATPTPAPPRPEIDLNSSIPAAINPAAAVANLPAESPAGETAAATNAAASTATAQAAGGATAPTTGTQENTQQNVSPATH